MAWSGRGPQGLPDRQRGNHFHRRTQTTVQTQTSKHHQTVRSFFATATSLFGHGIRRVRILIQSPASYQTTNRVPQWTCHKLVFAMCRRSRLFTQFETESVDPSRFEVAKFVAFQSRSGVENLRFWHGL